MKTLGNRKLISMVILYTIIIGMFLALYLYKDAQLQRVLGYTTQLHIDLGESAKAYDEAIKQVWSLEGELAYYKPSYESVSSAYNDLLKEEQKLRNRIMELEPLTIKPQGFPDVETARDWVLSHKLPIVLIAGEDGKVSFTDYSWNPIYDCDDYADDYEAMALSENILLWQCPVSNGEVWGVKVSETTENHIGLWTKINGIYYYIEPQSYEDEWRFVEIISAD